jgi:hypothetical protein
MLYNPQAGNTANDINAERAGAEGDDGVTVPYLRHLQKNPDALLAALGVPATREARAGAVAVAEAYAAKQASRYGVVHPKSVSEIMRRLAATDTPAARETAQALEQRSPHALEVTHRLLVEASTKPMADCLQLEYRVLNHWLGSHDAAAGLNAFAEGSANPVWAHSSVGDVSAEDVDAMFGPLPKGAERLRLPVHRRTLDDVTGEELEMYAGALEKLIENGEAPGAIGDLFRRRLVDYGSFKARTPPRLASAPEFLDTSDLQQKMGRMGAL